MELSSTCRVILIMAEKITSWYGRHIMINETKQNETKQNQNNFTIKSLKID